MSKNIPQDVLEQAQKDHEEYWQQRVKDLGGLSTLPNEAILHILSYEEKTTAKKPQTLFKRMREVNTYFNNQYLPEITKLGKTFTCAPKTMEQLNFLFTDQSEYVKHIDLSDISTNIDPAIGRLVPITDDIAIEVLKQHPDILSIDLSDCAITDKTLKYIADNCKEITDITLDKCTTITDGGIMALAEGGLTQLHSICLFDATKITMAPIESLLRQNPDREIVYHDQESVDELQEEIREELEQMQKLAEERLIEEKKQEEAERSRSYQERYEKTMNEKQNPSSANTKKSDPSSSDDEQNPQYTKKYKTEQKKRRDESPERQ